MVDLTRIHPSQGNKYSPNLYKWLAGAKYRRDTSEIWHPMNQSDTLFIGFVCREFRNFVGSRLGQVLCYGNKAASGEYIGMHQDSLLLIPNFWSEYYEIGRCAIDRDHSKWFVSEDRWETKGHVRRCKWCGNCTQKLVKKKVVSTHEAWVND